MNSGWSFSGTFEAFAGSLGSKCFSHKRHLLSVRRSTHSCLRCAKSVTRLGSGGRSRVEGLPSRLRRPPAASTFSSRPYPCGTRIFSTSARSLLESLRGSAGSVGSNSPGLARSPRSCRSRTAAPESTSRFRISALWPNPSTHRRAISLARAWNPSVIAFGKLELTTTSSGAFPGYSGGTFTTNSSSYPRGLDMRHRNAPFCCEASNEL
mmetsp:Transcript_25968/g.85398  ORF Transcript_25968/g.85398 Transcript_25968/m.85398 type:complete len:209 (-) Transcript_25968:275-901(-)